MRSEASSPFVRVLVPSIQRSGSVNNEQSTRTFHLEGWKAFIRPVEENAAFDGTRDILGWVEYKCGSWLCFL